MRKHNYVVGFEGETQCVYGKDSAGKASYTYPLTIFQAKSRVKKLFKLTRVKRCIYKLVLVESID